MLSRNLNFFSGLAAGLSVLLVGACGPQPEAYVGTYSGKLERTETRGQQTFKQDYEPYLVHVAPAETGDLYMQLRDECAVAAQMQDDGAFEIVGQPCKENLESFGLDAVVNGSGSVSEDGKLTVEFTLTGTTRRNAMDTQEYSSTESFTGEIQ